MPIRNLFSWLLIVAAFTLNARSFAPGEWVVEKTFHVVTR
jgi:hypothetical protein